MREEVVVVFVCSFLVLLSAFLVFNFQGFGITGEVVLNASEAEAFFGEEGEVNVSREEVVSAFVVAENIVEEMSESGFSVVYIEDNLIEAERVLQQVDYAEILRGNFNGSDFEKSKARAALALVDWKSLKYSDVMVYLEDIVERREAAFYIYDEINVINKSLKRYEDIDMSEVEAFLENANIAFYSDRYSEAEDFLEKAKKGIDSKRSEISVLGSLRRGAMTFIQKYWNFVLVFFILLGIILMFFYKRIKRYFLKKKILEMMAEKKALMRLIKRAQIDRFKKNKISGLVYNIRMKKYKDKLIVIKRELPILRRKLYA